MMGVVKFPDNKLTHWAKSYARIFYEKGQVEAGKYARLNIPQQFQKQLNPLVEKEYKRLQEKEE